MIHEKHFGQIRVGRESHIKMKEEDMSTLVYLNKILIFSTLYLFIAIISCTSSIYYDVYSYYY